MEHIPWEIRCSTIISNQGNSEDVSEIVVVETNQTVAYVHDPEDAAFVVKAYNKYGALVKGIKDILPLIGGVSASTVRSMLEDILAGEPL